MIGLFDSGLGGLTVVPRVRALLPQHDLLFLSDQANVPYGDRTVENLHRLFERHLAWLDARGVDAVVMACNTSCAVSQQVGWPPSRALVLDLIESAAISVHDAGFRRIAVIATAATARSGAYSAAIRRLAPGARVTEVAAPALVPLVEAGLSKSAPAREAVAQVCAQLPGDLDAAILACTHYPLLDEHFAAALGEGVARLDPAVEQAGRAAALVAARSFAPGSGITRYVTTGDLARFRELVAEITGETDPLCERLEVVAR